MNARLPAAAVLVAISTLLGGCLTKDGPASVLGGECKIFERPEYAVSGKRPYDQDWIDSQIEGGVGGCKWKRPAQRPAALDATPGHKPAPAPVKRRGIVQRIKARLMPGAAAPVPYTVAPVLPAIVETRAPPAPREPADMLLYPNVAGGDGR